MGPAKDLRQREINAGQGDRAPRGGDVIGPRQQEVNLREIRSRIQRGRKQSENCIPVYFWCRAGFNQRSDCENGKEQRDK